MEILDKILSKENLNDLVADLLIVLDQETLEKKFGDLMQSLHLLEKEGDKEKIEQVLSECGNLSYKIHEIKHKRASEERLA